jgi:hypothetical protein
LHDLPSAIETECGPNLKLLSPHPRRGKNTGSRLRGGSSNHIYQICEVVSFAELKDFTATK